MERRRRVRLRLVLRLAALGGLLGAVPEVALARDARPHSTPTMWHAEHADGRPAFYLLGSVHMGRPELLVFPRAVEEAFARADALVLEVKPDELDPVAMGRAMARHALIPPPASLRDRVSPHTIDVLSHYLEQRGDTLSPYLQLEPWALSLQVVAREARRSGLDPAHGVDRYFAHRAGRKPIVGLETTDAQLEMLARLPMKVQEQLLLDTLSHTRDVRDGTQALVAAWARGDDAELERIFYRPMYEAPALAVYYEQLVFGRNEAMTQRLASLARDGKLRFVVVGAGHMVGERGIPALLRDYGFALRRVE